MLWNEASNATPRHGRCLKEREAHVDEQVDEAVASGRVVSGKLAWRGLGLVCVNAACYL